MLASEAVVMNLSEPLLNQGYAIHTDNWYSSPTLFRLLLDNKTYALGTVRKHRKNMPAAVVSKKLTAGEVVHQSSNNILCLKWQDKKDILEHVTLPQYPSRGRPSLGPSPLRLQTKNWAHFVMKIPPTATKANPTKRCFVCTQKKVRSETVWQCEKCEIPLHIPTCFRDYHTKLNF
uniref:PiggyBac transposable element-derived protein domain-containing protein n=1 Tax=Timema monikensis TaxID=170555 RepID=A0A7R9EI36_9NEOP|nr:unnamed protein product [Timema monikensis]